MKLRTKLLLGATVVAGLSISAFAACATDVYMGNKQLKDVAEPTLTTDAATKGYVDGKSLIGTSYTTICDDTVRTLPIKTGAFSVNQHHEVALVQNHWSGLSILAGRQSYIKLDNNITHFTETSLAAAHIRFYSAYDGANKPDLQYRCGGDYIWAIKHLVY